MAGRLDFERLRGFCDRQTDRQTDGQTDRRTFAILESLSRLKTIESIAILSIYGRPLTKKTSPPSNCSVTSTLPEYVVSRSWK